MINENLVWSSAPKGFLGYTDFRPVIDRQAAKEFFDIGYLLENRSWFKGVQLVPPACVLTFDIEKSRSEIEHYWTWSKIKPIEGPVDIGEIVQELESLFRQAVCKRVNNNERIGITLSGGLDSRAILAAVPADYKHLGAFTFGQQGCDDIRIASHVSRIKDVEHHIVDLNARNWLELRPLGVWVTDGQLNLLHMHAITAIYDVYRKFHDIRLNGFLGDAVFGGDYIGDRKWSVVEKINLRGRRFINEGTRLLEAVVVNRNPFFDNSLMELVSSIPETMREDSFVYNRMLLRAFPMYYNAIPWQKTGCPISYSKGMVKLIEFRTRLTKKLVREFQRFGLKYKDLKHYANYPAWIRQEPARSFFEKLLLSKNALYPAYVNRNRIRTCMSDHMQGRANHDNVLCQALTFELWLKQVFEQKYRNI